MTLPKKPVLFFICAIAVFQAANFLLAHGGSGHSEPTRSSQGSGQMSRQKADVSDEELRDRVAISEKAKLKAMAYYFEQGQGLKIRLSNLDDRHWRVEILKDGEVLKRLIYLTKEERIVEQKDAASEVTK